MGGPAFGRGLPATRRIASAWRRPRAEIGFAFGARVNLLLIVVVVLGAVAIGVGLMYAVRHVATPDAFRADITRETAATFGVVGTAFAVLLAFVVFVGFQSYASARDAAASEASAVTTMFRTAMFWGPKQRDELQGQLACYARAVVRDDWPRMAHEKSSAIVDEWRLDLEATIRRLDLRTAAQRAAFSQLLDERDVRSDARRRRLLEASPLVSSPVWLILAFGAVATVCFVLLFTDRRQPFSGQAVLIGVVSAVVAASLLLVWLLDHPYEGKSGSIKPTEMQRTIASMGREAPALSPPCDESGTPQAR